MEHICQKPGKIDFSNYERYLQSIREKLPGHIYAFASNPDHFNLESRSSLHDAWLESLLLNEVATGQRNEIRQLEIRLTLLGPFHDRRIHLHYTGVTRYSLSGPSGDDSSRHRHIAHGDLFTHEIRLGEAGLFIHELLFARGAHFFVECANIRHSEEIIAKTLE